MNSATLRSSGPDISSANAERLTAFLRELGPVAVAYSGGVDSAVVARAAFAVWGARAVAITAISPSLAASDREIAKVEAARIGIRHVELSTSEFQRDEYRRNAGDRCFFCKDTLYTLAATHMSELGVTCLVNGANADDLGDYRPGMQAAKNHQVRSPLLELGLTKQEVRELARYWNLSVAEKPAAPCLSSRIAYGVEVTEERVHRIEMSEALIRRLTKVTDLRVRCEQGELARIEVTLSELPSLLEPEMRQQITDGLRSLGFRAVTVDLEGFRSGNLNQSLPFVVLEVQTPTPASP
ncbi:MAG: ATP-dependent sacrificial sulfur transferase LarE [Planctomycetota bacterium]